MSLLKGCPKDGGQKDQKLYKRSHGKYGNYFCWAGNGWYHQEEGADGSGGVGWGHMGGRSRVIVVGAGRRQVGR